MVETLACERSNPGWISCVQPSFALWVEREGGGNRGAYVYVGRLSRGGCLVAIVRSVSLVWIGISCGDQMRDHPMVDSSYVVMTKSLILRLPLPIGSQTKISPDFPPVSSIPISRTQQLAPQQFLPAQHPTGETVASSRDSEETNVRDGVICASG